MDQSLAGLFERTREDGSREMRMKQIATISAIAVLLFTMNTYGDACHKAVSFLKRVEDFRPSVYVCQAGERAIGYGFTDAALIARGHITRAEADIELKRKCERLIQKVRIDLKGRRITDTQMAAIVSFAYNVGWGNYRASKVRKMILNGRRDSDVAEELRKWVYVSKDGRKIRSRGLQKRRLSEAIMYAM